LKTSRLCIKLACHAIPDAVLAVFLFHASAPLLRPDGALRINPPVSGRVDIIGAAAVPRMIRRRFSFAFDPDPTGTRFTIAEDTQPAGQGVPAQWVLSAGAGIAGAGFGLFRLRSRFPDWARRRRLHRNGKRHG
jgi:hypothetical protein